MKHDRRLAASARIALALALALATSTAAPAQAPPAGEPSSDGSQSTGQARKGDHDDFVEYVEVNVSDLPKSNTIATKLPTPLQLTPANVGVVTREVLREQNALELGEALKNVSSLNVQVGPAVTDFFTIRGFDSISSSLVLTDGAIEPEATFYQMYNVEGVEVLKGPSGFLYGSFALAGTVNMVCKQPVPTDFAVLSAQAGSFGRRQGTLDWNFASQDGTRSFRLNGLWREADNYRDDKQSRHAALNPSFTWRPGDATTLNFNLEYLDAEVSPDAGIPLVNRDASFQPTPPRLPDVPRRRSYQSPFDFSNQTIPRFQFDLEHRLSDAIKLRNKLFYRGLDWESDGTLFGGTLPVLDPNFMPTGEQLVLRTYTRLDDRQDFVGNLFEAIVEAATGGVRHNLLAGIEIGRYADEFSIDVLPPQGTLDPNPSPCSPTSFGMPCIGLNDPVETLQQRPGQLLPLQSGDARSLVVAPYVTNQIKFSQAFHLMLGLRWDEIDFEDDQRGISRSYGKLSPQLGLLWAPADSLSVYGNTGRSFAPPSPRLSDNELNTFEPEEATQIELGVKKRFGGDMLRTTFAAYEVERENIPITLADGFTQQAGDQRSRGLEIELAAEPARRLRTLFVYAYTDAELVRFSRCDQPVAVPCPVPPTDLSGNRPPYAPEHLANLWVSQGFRNGLGVSGGVRYVGSQFIDVDNAYELDPYLILRAMIHYEWRAWRFRLNLDNLTDEEYETGSFSSTSVVPADPFAVYGTVEYRF